MEEKHCPDCNKIKPTNQFYKNAASGDGLQWVCKPCSRERSRVARQNNRARNEKNPKKENKKTSSATSELIVFKKVTPDDAVRIGKLFESGVLFFKNKNGIHKIDTERSVGSALASGCLYKLV